MFRAYLTQPTAIGFTRVSNFQQQSRVRAKKQGSLRCAQVKSLNIVVQSST